jgi:dephospho-CoA kinase
MEQTRPATPQPVIGVIGGIGSGKSRVAAILAERGGRVVSGDEAGHQALKQATVKDRIAKRWGQAVFDEHGEVNRRRLGEIVFANAGERRALEDIVFPFIEARLRQQIAAVRTDAAAKFVVLDAAVMLEAGWDKECDVILFVHTPAEERLRRLQEQRGWTEKELRARENAQMPLAEKRARADAVVDNSGTPETLSGRIDEVLWRWGLP